MNTLKKVNDEAIGLQAISTHSTGVSSALAVPHADARAVLVQPLGLNVIVSFDGTVPSASYGHLLVANRKYVLSAALMRPARAIGDTGTVTVVQQSLA